MNVVLLLGGRGTRFKNENYCRPKPLINIAGKPIIRWLLDMLVFNKEDHFYVVYQQDLESNGFLEVLRSAKHIPNVSLYSIVNDTRGACETLLCLLHQLTLTELSLPTITLDGDTFYEKIGRAHV